MFASDKVKIGHNLKFDLQSVTKYLGTLPAQPYACTLNAAFILNTQNRNSLGLDDCLKREFDYNMVKGGRGGAGRGTKPGRGGNKSRKSAVTTGVPKHLGELGTCKDLE